jgi:hypothetical protein
MDINQKQQFSFRIHPAHIPIIVGIFAIIGSFIYSIVLRRSEVSSSEIKLIGIFLGLGEISSGLIVIFRRELPLGSFFRRNNRLFREKLALVIGATAVIVGLAVMILSYLLF